MTVHRARGIVTTLSLMAGRGTSRRLWPAAALLGVAGCGDGLQDGPFARARVIGGLDEAIGGDMAVARPGDFVLENDRVRVAILTGRNSKGPSLYGGSLVDADLQWADPSTAGGRGRDQWNELFPLASMNVPFASDPPSEPGEDTGGGVPGSAVDEDGNPLYEGPSVFIQEQGDGERAVVRVVAPATPFLSLLDLLWGIVSMPDMWLVSDYIAEPGEPWITLRTTVAFEQGDAPKVAGTAMEPVTEALHVIAVGLQKGLVGGDFFLAGGNVDVFAPGIGFDEDGAVYEADLAGRNTFTEPFRFPFVAAVGDGVSYGIVAQGGDVVVPLFTSSQTAVVGASVLGGKAPEGVDAGDWCKRFACDAAYTFERYFIVGHGDVGSIVDAWIDIKDLDHGTITGRVVEQSTGRALSGVDVFVYEPGAEEPFSQWRTDVNPDDPVQDGSFAGALPVGTWELRVHQNGRPALERVTVEVREGEDLTVRLEALRPGVLTFDVRDETGRSIPAKVTIFRTDVPEGERALKPELGDGFIGGDPQWVVFADQGSGEVALAEGDYYAVASRGTEYELGISDAFHVDAARGHHLQLQVIRSIDTEGWISADLHVHSAPSHDSGVTLPDRVRSMVAEGVEFFVATDHDYLSDFAPVVEEMGHEAWVQTAVGVETTTVEIGHYLGFPMQKRFLGDVGGAMDWTGLTPEQIIFRLRRQGERAGFDPLVFVAHPRSGILGYFDQFGFDPHQGEASADPAEREVVADPTVGGLPNPNPLLVDDNLTLDFDALELFTGKELWSQRTPTEPEVAAFTADGGDDLSMYRWLTRTAAEQQDLIDGVYKLSGDFNGAIEDWFTLLNLGYRHTALGNSDTHDRTSIESGCPRNFVMSSTDSPAFIDDQEIADAVKAHRVVASYGPFVQLWIDGAGIGSDVEADGPIEARIEVQAPSWIDVDRVALYENGTLIRELSVDPGAGNVRLAETLELTPEQDAWYVVIVTGDGSMEPVFTPVELPPIPLDEVVTDALGVIPLVGTALGAAVPYPKVHPTHPFALTNPIWVDVDGGGFEPPGIPAWMQVED